MKLNAKILLTIVLIIALLGSIGAAIYFYKQYSNVKNSNAQAELTDLKSKLAAHMMLPSEEPTLATVTDKSKLEGQPFFQGAENGDKVLIFTQAKRAVLYRPSSDRIIDVVPVNVTQPVNPSEQEGIQQDANTDEQSNAGSTSIAILNTTGRDGLGAQVEQQIQDGKVGTISTTVNDNYQGKRYYDQTVVVSVNEASRPVAEKIAKLLGVTVTTLPVEESKPSSDVAVFLGFDRR